MSWLIRPLNPQTYVEELLRMRSKRTPTVRKGARGDAYTVGLQQALDLWQAAGKVEPLASPILRYYAVTQAAQAIAAASPLGNQSWKPGHSHGLTCEVGYPRSNGRLWRGRLDLDNDTEAVDTRRLIDTQSVDAICLVTQTLQGFLSP